MSEVEMQNLLDALTDAMLAEQDDHAARLSRINDDMTTFARLIAGLRGTLRPQTPSERFMRQLKHDLVGQNQGMVARLSAVPARVHIATGIAAGIAGIMWISRRQVRDEEDDSTDISALTQGS